MYMQSFKWHVIRITSTKRLDKAKAPVFCANNPSTYLEAPKQMIACHQLSVHNVETPGDVTFPCNEKMGFFPGAQNDIYEVPKTITTRVATLAPTHLISDASRTARTLSCHS